MGAGVSKAFSEGLSDTGDVTGQGNPFVRGAIWGRDVFLGGVFHTLPLLLPNYHAAIVAAVVVIGAELRVLAWLPYTSSTSTRVSPGRSCLSH